VTRLTSDRGAQVPALCLVAESAVQNVPNAAELAETLRRTGGSASGLSCGAVPCLGVQNRRSGFLSGDRKACTVIVGKALDDLPA